MLTSSPQWSSPGCSWGRRKNSRGAGGVLAETGLERIPVVSLAASEVRSWNEEAGLS